MSTKQERATIAELVVAANEALAQDADVLAARRADQGNVNAARESVSYSKGIRDSLREVAEVLDMEDDVTFDLSDPLTRPSAAKAA